MQRFDEGTITYAALAVNMSDLLAFVKAPHSKANRAVKAAIVPRIRDFVCKFASTTMAMIGKRETAIV